MSSMGGVFPVVGCMAVQEGGGGGVAKVCCAGGHSSNCSRSGFLRGIPLARRRLCVFSFRRKVWKFLIIYSSEVLKELSEEI